MMMQQLIQDFSSQLREAIQIGQQAEITGHDHRIENVLVTGLGGSGIGGNLVGEMVIEELKVPFQVNKDYFLPAFVNENTLVIVSSYSGNTEETLSAFEIAVDKRAKIVCISSGGKLIEKAQEFGYDHIIVPGGAPPRACLGYSMVQQLYVLKGLGLISDRFETDLEDAIELLDDNEADMQEAGRELAEKLYDKIPILYTTTPFTSVAVRFRQQLNENSKVLCWHHVIPEMNHNELVGWRTEDNSYCPVFLRTNNDYSRNKHRMEINKRIISRYTDSTVEVFARGESYIEQALYLIHLTDWASCFLAELRGVDAVEVEVIDYLKGELAKS